MTGQIPVLFGIVLAATLLHTAGCYRPVEPPVLVDLPSAAPSKPQYFTVGWSVEGRPIKCLVLGDGDDVTLILAAIHGDEPAGVPLVRALAAHLAENPQLLHDRRVVLLPVANPDGLLYDSRTNAHAVDLNRDFPASNRPSNSPPNREPESRVIAQLIRQYRVDRIVSIHQLTDTGPQALVNRVPHGCIDYDGPAKKLAEHIARYCNLSVERLGPAPGSLGSHAGLDLHIPCITMELPLAAEMLGAETLWQRYGRALLAAVLYPEDLPASPAEKPRSYIGNDLRRNLPARTNLEYVDKPGPEP